MSQSAYYDISGNMRSSTNSEGPRPGNDPSIGAGLQILDLLLLSEKVDESLVNFEHGTLATVLHVAITAAGTCNIQHV